MLVLRAAAGHGPITDRRLRAISYTHNGKPLSAVVGKPDALHSDEVVIAILECKSGLCLIYTEKERRDGILGPYLASPTSTVVFDSK